MKNQLSKILTIVFVILFFITSKSYSIEEITELTDAINDAREEFNNASDASTEQSKIIDQALKEIDKATEYVQEAINNNNTKDAIKTLEFIEKSLSDVESIIPQEFGTDMSNMDVSAISKDDMDTVNEVTSQMNVAKEEKLNKFMSELVDLNQKGIDTVSISENLNSMGIDTIKIAINLNENKQIETWTKEEWANSYKGSILTSDGSEITTDKEVSSKIIELEGKFQENTIKIESKRAELLNLNNQLNPISSKLKSLNEKKSSLTSQYNFEVSKLSAENLTNLEAQKSIELSEKLQNELENVTNEALKAEQQSALFETEISAINKSLNEQILQSNKISEDINNLNKNKLELSEEIALRTVKLNELKGQNSNLSSDSNIAELTVKLDESEKLKTQLTDLQSQIENKNLVVSEKITEVNSLNSQLDPLSEQIKSLEAKREALQNQYNSEISNLSNSFNNNELIKSQALAANLNNDINLVTSEIKSIEVNSSKIKKDISQIALEITSEKDSINKITFEISNAQKNLDNTLSVISSKEFQLDQLKNTDLAQTNQNLKEELNQISLQKDFIESQFDSSINLEVEALQRYHTALGDTAEEIDFAMREVGVILDSDPRKARAFEIEKYATYAGLSKDFIQNSINAVNNDDWDKQKSIYEDITKALAKNPNWVVDVPSNAEINVMIAEEKAIQEAALASLNVEEINRKWNTKITEQAKEFQPLVGLSTTTLRYAATWEGMAEHEPLTAEIDKVLSNNSELKNITAELEEKQKQLKEIQVFQQLKTQEINNAIKPLQDQVANTYAEINDINRNYNLKSLEKTTYIDSIGGYAALYRDKGNSNYGDWVKNIGNFDQELGDIRSKSQEKYTEAQNISNEIYEIKLENSTPQTDLNNWTNLQRDVGNLAMKKIGIEGNAVQLARSNLIVQVEEAKLKYNEIISQENPELKAVEDKVSSILKEVPTFKVQADSLAGLDATTLRAKLVDLTNGSNNETEALKAAREAMSEMGKAPVSEYMTGAYWEMTNVKAAAIVRSKKYDYVDDYEYINAFYRDPLELNTSQRQEIETELKNVLGKNNPKLNALNNQVNSLKLEIDTNNSQLTNINENISKLENEISSIKSSEENLKNQISNLNSDLLSKQSIIDEKNKSLTDLQKNLDPINNKISELEDKKNDLNNNIQNQINLISENSVKSEEIAEKTTELENKLSKELLEIDQQIDGYKKDTDQLSVNISTLNKDILALENDKPNISNKISKINEELIGYSNVKAELSLLSQEKKVEVENIDIEINKLESELSNLKTSESQINQQLASLSNELKSKEDIIKNKNLSISEIQKQIDPLNNQIKTLKSQKVSLNEQFNKDLEELSNQIEQSTEVKSTEVDKLKADFETQMSKLNEEINNFETQTNDLNSTVSALDEEIKSIEVKTPQITDQIESLNQDLKNFVNIKADLAMATAKKIGLDVDEQALKSVEILDGKVVITIKGTELVRVVDEKMLTDQAAKFIDPISELSINSKIYSSYALKPDLITQELVKGTYEVAKEAREKAVKRVNELETIGASKAEIQVAKDASDAAKFAEIAAGQSLVSNANIASASISSQQQTLKALKQVASTPGMNKWNVRRANEAVKAAEAQIAGVNYDYESAINKIANDEQKFNVWRADDYKKEIEAAKASGSAADLKAYTRRLNNFQKRLIDEREAFEAATARTEYFDAISKVIENNTVGISSSSVKEAVKSASDGSNQINEFTTAYDSAKSAREEIDKNLNSLRQASGGATTAAIDAAEAARSVALQAEISAANVVAANSTAVQEAAQVAAAAAQEAAQEVAQEVAQVAQEAAQSAAETALATLKEVASTPGMNKWDVRRANAAVKAQESKMSGSSYDYQGAVDKINNDEKAWNDARGN
jgi:chromosome segregation ATPase